MQVVADLHLHSKYSRAVSPKMTLPVMSLVGRQKGIDLLATGDWTHPLWMKEIRSQLEESEEGLYRIKSQIVNSKSQVSSNHQSLQSQKEIKFLLSAEISCIYSQNGKGRRVHNLVFVPSFEAAEKINRKLIVRGCNLTSDGRPIIGLSSKHLLELILSIDERSLLIPAHIWTPWFGILGMKSGFASLQESFEELADYVYGIETGISSDPEMNWEIGELDTRSILSFSDAHSPAKMGREATIFELEDLSYKNIRKAIMAPSQKPEARSKNQGNRIVYTIEFYPEEGKYHYSGHRACGITMTPEEQRQSRGVCPVCGRLVTDGVMRRVQELANENPRASTKQNTLGVKWLTDPKGQHPPFVKIIPLNEIISAAIGSPITSPKVNGMFNTLTTRLESELFVLLKAPLEEIAKIAGERIAEGVQKVREGKIVITPGYDGVYGKVRIWPEKKDEAKHANKFPKTQKVQLGLDL